MRVLFVLFAVFVLSVCACSPASPAARQPAVVLAAADALLDAELLERVRDFAQRELRVPVRTLDTPGLAELPDFQALEQAVQPVRADGDVIFILLTAVPGETQHLAVFPEDELAAVNVPPLRTDDREIFARRVERQVMRAAAFAVGLPPTPDPFCVTRNYRSLEDLDRMGRNFSPPWQGRFAEEAARRGLLPPASGGAPKTPTP